MRRRSGQTEGDGIARRRRHTVTSYSSPDDWIQMPELMSWWLLLTETEVDMGNPENGGPKL